MVIIALAICLFVIGFILRKHPGMAILGSVAGSAVYTAMSPQLNDLLRQIVQNGPISLILSGILLFLTVIAPLLVYFKASGGLTGLNRIIAAIVLALFISILASPALLPHIKFDTISAEIWGNIEQFKDWILLSGILIAYLDIILTRKKIK